MKDLLRDLFSSMELGYLPAAGIVLLFSVMVVILVWTFLPSNRYMHEKNARLTLDEGENNG